MVTAKHKSPQYYKIQKLSARNCNNIRLKLFIYSSSKVCISSTRVQKSEQEF